MNIHPIDGDCGTMTAALREMTAEQLLDFGKHHMVYLKAGMHDGELSFVLFGADGLPLASTDSVETAVEIAAEQGFEFVPIH
jgi:hypothetical protein